MLSRLPREEPSPALACAFTIDHAPLMSFCGGSWVCTGFQDMPTSEMGPWTFSICTPDGKGLRAIVQLMGRLGGSCGGEERRKTGGGAGNEDRWAAMVGLVLMATIAEIYLVVVQR